MRGLQRASLIFAMAVLAGCGPAQSHEQQVRDVIARMELAAEQRDVGDLLAHLTAEYRDASGQDSREAARQVRGYFIAHQSIHLLTRVESIEFASDQEARARVLVGMLGSPGHEPISLDLAADLYEFDIALVRDSGKWKVNFARWQRR